MMISRAPAQRRSIQQVPPTRPEAAYRIASNHGTVKPLVRKLWPWLRNPQRHGTQGKPWRLETGSASSARTTGEDTSLPAHPVLHDRACEAAEIAPIAPNRVRAPVHVRGMVHRDQDHTVYLDGRRAPWSERSAASRQFAPRDEAEARDHARPCDCKFRLQVIAAVGDLVGIGVTIATQLIARVAAHQIGDENAGEPRLRDHLMQQFARTIAAEGLAGSITTVTPGGNSHKHDCGGHRPRAGNRLRAATHQCIAARAGAYPGLKIGESQSLLSRGMRRPARHWVGHLTRSG